MSKPCEQCLHASKLTDHTGQRWCFHTKFASFNVANGRMETSRRCDVERARGHWCGREGLLFSQKKQTFWQKVKEMIFD